MVESAHSCGVETVGTKLATNGYIGIGLVVYAFVGILAAVAAWHRLAAKASCVLEQWAAWKQTSPCRDLPLPDRAYGGGSRLIHYFGTAFGAVSVRGIRVHLVSGVPLPAGCGSSETVVAVLGMKGASAG